MSESTINLVPGLDNAAREPEPLGRTAEQDVGQPTVDCYGEILSAFGFFRQELFAPVFGVMLPDVMLTVPRDRRLMGYFAPESWHSRAHGRKASEIALNPVYFDSTRSVYQTLCHEMCHLGQSAYPAVFGKPGKGAYHNRAFADAMAQIGLMASQTGKPGGRRTGYGMNDYVIADGPFDRACRWYLDRTTELSWTMASAQASAGVDASDADGGNAAAVRRRHSKRKSKTKYTCPGCGLNAWAKPGAPVGCTACGLALRAEGTS